MDGDIQNSFEPGQSGLNPSLADGLLNPENDMPSPETTPSSAASPSTTPNVQIPDRLFFRIGDVSELVGVKPYVLRYWESEFPILSPSKSVSGQRVYRRSEVETLLLIKHLLYNERYSIEGARKRIRELKKEGEMQSFKREKVLGGESVALDKLKLLHKMAEELVALAQKPIRDFFKY
ncbi:MAG: MerR family transcriptional regulator [Bacteriovoracia bacterium]